jgi:4-hydroxy-3-methylbut-2-enyl diphosphate reductase IspH
MTIENIWNEMINKHMDGVPQSSTYACDSSAWIQTDLFTQWIRHSIQHVKPTAQDGVLLVLVGHNSHYEFVCHNFEQTATWCCDSPSPTLYSLSI